MTSRDLRSRGGRLGRLATGFVLLLLTAVGYAVEAVDSIGITVTDLDRARAFYRDVLGFREQEMMEVAGEDYERLFGVFGMRLVVLRMQLGEEHIELMQFLAPAGRPIPADSRSNDRWFQHIAIITPDMERAYRWLREHKVAHASSGPQRLPDWNPNAGGISAFYFRDPDGNHLEILQFPPGKGAAKWHDEPEDRLFLGIDHTAIVVADTDASLAFYRDLLGLRIVGTSENYGPEQERLNNVFGAHLRITALRADGGPGIEFLEYLAPAGGRPMPADSRANDLWHWQINLRSDDVAGEWTKLSRARSAATPARPVSLRGELGFSSGVIIRDPDGHASALVQR